MENISEFIKLLKLLLIIYLKCFGDPNHMRGVTKMAINKKYVHEVTVGKKSPNISWNICAANNKLTVPAPNSVIRIAVVTIDLQQIIFMK